MRSLRLRLVLSAAGLIALAMGLACVGLVVIFDRVLDARTAQDLERTAKFLAGQVALDPNGALSLTAEPGDLRLSTPYGGLYWQIDAVGRQALRSRSLWDKRLSQTPIPADVGRPSIHDIPGPDGSDLIAVVLSVAIGPGHAGAQGAETQVTIVVAMDRRELSASRATYLSLLVPSLVALGLVLALAMWAFVQQALAPFRALREDLRAIHDGRGATLPSRYPDEVQPLADDLNHLIGVQERALSRARTQAGDMAHGLKTPLAVLSALARRVVDQDPTLSREIEEQTLAMGRQVDRSLARARIVAAGNLQARACLVAPVVERLVGALRRLPDAGSLTWQVTMPATFAFPGDEGDLTEMLGGLLDNARKWAHRRVVVAATRTGLAIEDDGPGMSQDAMANVARGQRWDESKPGTGFGLAIVLDIAQETGVRLTLAEAELGGLRVNFDWVGVDGGQAPPKRPA